MERLHMHAREFEVLWTPVEEPPRDWRDWGQDWVGGGGSSSTGDRVGAEGRQEQVSRSWRKRWWRLLVGARVAAAGRYSYAYIIDPFSPTPGV